MTMNDVYEISTPDGDIKEIEIDGKTAWERAVDETKTGATPIIANATREGNASAYQIWGNAHQDNGTYTSDSKEVTAVGIDEEGNPYFNITDFEKVVVGDTVNFTGDELSYSMIATKVESDNMYFDNVGVDATVEGETPLQCPNSTGKDLIDWSITGNAPYQEWTPSPEKERTANLLDVKEIYPPNAFTYSGEEITAINTAFAQTRINLSSYIGKTLTFSAEIKKESGITRAYLRANIGGEIIDSADILKNSEYTYVSITFTPKTSNDNVGITYGSGTNQMSAMHIMLNEGSTALPYEPYGYREKTGPCEVKGVGDRTRNLLDISTIHTTNSTNWTIERVNGKLTINHNNSYSTGIPKTNPLYLKGGTYILYFKGNSKAIDLYVNGSYVTFIMPSIKKPFTINDGDIIDFRFNNNNIGMAEYYDITLNEGSEPLSYEPYGYKTTVVDEGKQLLNVKKLSTGTAYGVTVDYRTDNTIKISGTIGRNTNYGVGQLSYALEQFDIGFEPDTRYTLSMSGRKSNDFYIQINGEDENKQSFALTNLMNGANTRSFKLPSNFVKLNALFVGIYGASYGKTIDEELKIQIEKGDSATPYVPYREPIETTIYHDEPYFTNDYIRKDKDGGVEHRGWGKLVLTGAEAYQRQGVTYDNKTKVMLACHFLSIQDIGMANNLTKCSHLKLSGSPQYSMAPDNSFGQNPTVGYRNYLYFNPSRETLQISEEEKDATTILNAWTSWLKSEYDKGTPVTIYYPLYTPTDTPKDLPDIVTASGYNSIDTDTQIKPSTMSVTYNKSIEFTKPVTRDYSFQYPSPLHLSEVKGVGEKTENLFITKNIFHRTITEEGYWQAINSSTSVLIDVEPNTTYYVYTRTILPIFRIGEFKKRTDDIFTNTIRLTDTNHIEFTTRPDTTAIVFQGSQALESVWLDELIVDSGYKTTVVDEGKNLFDKTGITFTKGLKDDTGNIVASQSHFTTQYTSVSPNTQYLWSGTITIDGTTRIYFYDANKKWISRTTTSTLNQRPFTTPSNCYYIQFQVTTTVSNVSDWQLELGTTATPYVPYREPIETTIYHDEPYFTGDYVRKDKDGGIEHRRWNKIVLTGDEEIGVISGNAPFTIQAKGLKSPSTTGILWKCSHYESVSNKTSWINYESLISWSTSTSLAEYLVIRHTAFYSDVATYKSWLKRQYENGTPVTIYYQLATPTDTPKGLPEIQLVNGYNSIDTDTQIKPEQISVTYLGKDGN